MESTLSLPSPADPNLRWDGDLLIRDGHRLVSVRKDVFALVLPDFIRVIEPLAFYPCPSLTVLVLPPDLEAFSPRCVEVCPQLTHLFSPAQTDGRCFSHNGILYAADCSLVCCPPGRQGGVTVPDWVVHIRPAAFAGCHRLEEVTLPEGLETIGDRAFLGCLELEALCIPDTVRTVGHQAFAACPSLRRVVFDGADTEFEEDTFDPGSDATVLVLPASAAEELAEDFGLPVQWNPDLFRSPENPA